MTHLDLSSNKLVTLDSGVFSPLVNLKDINLTENYFESLPIELFKENKNLFRFMLMDNQVEMKTLPAGLLANLPQLNIVNLACGLTNIPSNLFQGSNNIETLVLTKNHLNTLPTRLFAKMKKVTKIILQYNYLTQLHDDLFKDTNSLLELQLSHNQLEQISG